MYLNEKVPSEVYRFHEQMEDLYAEADLALTRAGAGTLFELALFSLPAIVIPYPHAEGHQELNARFFEKQGALAVLSENEASPEKLKKEISRLMNSHVLRAEMSGRLHQWAYPDAARRLVEAAEELCR